MILRYLSLLLFPATCLCCQKRTGDIYLCNSCQKHLPIQTKNTCPMCQKHSSDTGQTCMICSESCPLDGSFGAFSYKETLVKNCIETLKYNFIPSLAQPLGTELAQKLRFLPIPLPDFLVPIPLHPFRFRYRGFNQSELLANYLSSSLLPPLPLPVRNDILQRIRYTKSQARTKSRKERLHNLKNAFALHKKCPEGLLSGKRVWLIDDVATTNATLIECASILKQHGASEVWGIVVAR